MYLHLSISLSSLVHINVFFSAAYTLALLTPHFMWALPLFKHSKKKRNSSLRCAFCLLTINTSWEMGESWKTQILIICLKICHLKVLQKIWFDSVPLLWVTAFRKYYDVTIMYCSCLFYCYFSVQPFSIMSKTSHGDWDLWRPEYKPSTITFKEITLHSAP